MNRTRLGDRQRGNNGPGFLELTWDREENVEPQAQIQLLNDNRCRWVQGQGPHRLLQWW